MGINASENRVPAAYFFGRRELKNFLEQFYLPQNLRNGFGAKAAQEAYPKNNQDVLEQIKQIWDKKELPSALEIIETLLKNAMGEKAQILPYLIQIETELYQPNADDHFFQKEHSAILSALAHAYALEGHETVTILEGDGLNIGGTNYECFRRLLNQKYPSETDEKSQLLTLLDLSVSDDKKAFKKQLAATPKPLQKTFQTLGHDSMALVDKVIDLLKLSTLKTLKESVSKNAKIIPIRTGGDEFRIILTGIQPEKYPALTQAIHDNQKPHLQALGLTGHKHLKKSNQQGTGLVFAAFDLSCVLSNEGFHQCSATAIQENKVKISTQYKTYNYAEQTPAEMETYIRRSIKEHQKALNLTNPTSSSIVPFLEEYERAKKPQPFFTPPNRVRLLIFNEALENRDTPIDPFQRLYGANLVRRSTPIDPVTGFYMQYDLEKIITIYNQDGQNLAKALKNQGTPHNGNACHPKLITLEAGNLSGLNKALNHHGANHVLRYIKERIIEESLHENGIPTLSDLSKICNIHGVHCGGGKFVIVIPPASYKIKGSHTRDDLWALNTFEKIANAIGEKATQLNQKSIADILGPECPTYLTHHTIGSIPSGHQSRATHGVPISWAIHTINFPAEKMTPEEFIQHAWHEHAQHAGTSVYSIQTQSIGFELT